MANNKLISWAKSHKIAASAIGCGGLIVVGFVLILVLGLVLMATGNAPVEPVAEPETTSAAPKKPSPKPTKTAAPTPKAAPTKTQPTKSKAPAKTTAAPNPKKSEKKKPPKTQAAKPKTESFDAQVKKIRPEAKMHTEFDNQFVEIEAADPLLKITDQGDTLDILKAYKKSGMKQKQVSIMGKFDDAIAFNVTYERDTVKRLDLENTAISDIWDKADRSFVHDQWK